MQSRYRVKGMGCDACVKRVEKAVSALAGVERALVDLTTQTLVLDVITSYSIHYTKLYEVSSVTLLSQFSRKSARICLNSILPNVFVVGQD